MRRDHVGMGVFVIGMFITMSAMLIGVLNIQAAE